MEGREPLAGPLQQGSLQGVDIQNNIKSYNLANNNMDLNDSGIDMNSTNYH